MKYIALFCKYSKILLLWPLKIKITLLLQLLPVQNASFLIISYSVLDHPNNKTTFRQSQWWSYLWNFTVLPSGSSCFCCFFCFCFFFVYFFFFSLLFQKLIVWIFNIFTYYPTCAIVSVLRAIGTLAGEATLTKLFYPPSERGSSQSKQILSF